MSKKNFKINELISTLSEIDKISIPKFPITGNYLIDNGIKNLTEWFDNYYK